MHGKAFIMEIVRLGKEKRYYLRVTDEAARGKETRKPFAHGHAKSGGQRWT